MMQWASFWSHVEELRQMFMRMMIVLILGMGLALYFYEPILHVLTQPLKTLSLTQTIHRQRFNNKTNDSIFYQLPPEATAVVAPRAPIQPGSYYLLPKESIDYDIVKDHLLILSPLEGFKITCKTCFWLSLSLTSPIWMYFILCFVGPGLETKEKKILIPFVIGSICAMGSGIAVAYKLSIPMANEYLMQFNQTVGVNSWTLEGYINYTLILMLGHIIAFEIGWLVLLMVHFRWLSAEWMIAQRRYMIVAAFIIGAALTPPDVLTQLLIALPLILFYEAGIYYAKLLGKLSYPNIN